MMIFFFFIVGLIIGSFLNVVVCRLRADETILGRSLCRSCRNQIAWYDNIPLLSFVLLRGRCRYCQTTISVQYPLLELSTGIVFALVGYAFFAVDDPGTWVKVVWLLGVVALFLALAVYDLKYMELPVVLLAVSALWTVFFLAWMTYGERAVTGFGWQSPMVQGLVGGGIVAGFFFMLVFLSKETWMGWGDVWLGGVAGMIVGLHSILMLLTLSFGVGAFCGILMMLFGNKNMKSQIPFAPYLVIGALLVVILPQFLPILNLWFFL